MSLSIDEIIIVETDFSNEHHCESFLDMLNKYALSDEGGNKPLSGYVLTHLTKNYPQVPDAYSFLAFKGKTAVGLLNCIQGFSTFQSKPLMNIHDLVVKAEFRRQGIAKRLFDSAEKIAVRNGCCKMTLEVLSRNQPAQTLYAKLGYKNYELDPVMGHALFLEKPLTK